MTRPLRYGSVCSGIEAVTVAWEPPGLHAAWFSEIEPFACALLKHYYPTVPNHGDMTTLEARILAREVEAPDIFVGGPPCQAFSVAGLRNSLSDERGNLTLAFVRIANAIDHIRRLDGRGPCVVLYENVPGIFSTDDNAFGAFLGGLCGRDAALPRPRDGWTHAGVVVGPARGSAWRVMDAQYFGLAQRRARVYCIASGHPHPLRCADALLPVVARSEWHPQPGRTSGERVAPTVEARATAGGGGWGTDFLAGGGLAEVAHAVRAKGNLAHREDADTLIPVAYNAEGAEGFTFTRSNLGKSLNNQTPLAVIPFDETQITSRDNRSNPQPGDPSHALARGARPPSVVLEQPVAFTCKDHGQDAGDLAPTLRSMHQEDGNANGGGQVAVLYAQELADPITTNEQCTWTHEGSHFRTRNLTAFAFAQRTRDGVKAVEVMPDGLAPALTNPGDGGRADAVNVAVSVDEPVLAFKPGQSEEAGGIFITKDVAPTLQAQSNGSTAVPAVAFQPRIARNGRGQPSDVVPALNGASAGETSDMRPCVMVPPGEPVGSFQQNSLTGSGTFGFQERSEILRPVKPQPDHQMLVSAMHVRRLMPVETERLQGFPDGYAHIPYNGKPAKDGPRYRAIGNSMATHKMRYLGERILAVFGAGA